MQYKAKHYQPYLFQQKGKETINTKNQFLLIQYLFDFTVLLYFFKFPPKRVHNFN